MQESNKFSFNTDESLGIFTAVALILLLWGFCWYKTYLPFEHGQHINVIFPEIAGLHENAGVYVHGMRVGCVETIKWYKEQGVLVRLRVNRKHLLIPEGSKFSILPYSLIGAKYVEITLPQLTDIPRQPIDESRLVIGESPVRPEIVLNRFIHSLDQIDIDRLQHNIAQDQQTLRHTANQISLLASKTIPVVDRALPLEDNLAALSSEMRTTLRKLNKFADNPKLSSDLKNIVNKACEAAQTAQAAIRELNTTVTDKSLRDDIQKTMSQLNQSTAQFEQSIETLQQISKDKDLRSDVKQILENARKAIEKLDHIFNNPDSETDIRSTLKRTRDTLTDIDLAARQLQQILDQRHPIIHMFLGRPGHIKEDNTVKVQP